MDADQDLNLDRIEEAARSADPAFRDSPQFVSEELCAALGRTVLVKIETLNPVGSFKGRGAASWCARCLRAPPSCARRAETSAWPLPTPRGRAA